MTKLKKATLLAVILLFTYKVGFSQTAPVVDSIVFYLGKIKSPNDRAPYNEVLRLFNENKKNVLFENKKITLEFGRLKTVLDEKLYSLLVFKFYQSHIYFDSPPNSEIIKHGRGYFEKNFDDAKGNTYFSLLALLRELRIPYRNSNQIYDGIEFFNRQEKKFIARQDSNALTIVYNVLSGFYKRLGLNDRAVYYMLKSIDYLDDTEYSDNYDAAKGFYGKKGKVNRFSVLGSYFLDINDPKSAERELQKAITKFGELKNKMDFSDASYLFLQMAKCKTQLGSESSTRYYNVALQYLDKYRSSSFLYAHYYMEKGNDLILKGQLDSAIYYVVKSKLFKDSLHLGIPSISGDLVPNYYYAKIKLLQNQPKEAISLLHSEMEELRNSNQRIWLLKELRLLADAYGQAGMEKQASVTFKEILTIKEKLDEEEKATKSISFEIEKKLQADDIRIAVLNAQEISSQRAKYYLFGISALLALFVFTLGIAINTKQRSNARLKIQNDETVRAFEQLKATQTQLIQSEKMASLGELTAGIAHEIQNPLNFVNNFSEVSTELLDEMNTEIEKGDYEEVRAIAGDIKVNLEKILHHGKRADAIVKGMLQHSRSSSGQKEPTDINALCDEYLRLAYHGLRAKDKSFNAGMETAFDETIGKIEIVPQDIGRVILNLITNSFYAVNERLRQAQPDNSSVTLSMSKGEDKFEPMVSVSTKKSGDQIEISVKDNGNGIPQNILDKIFQPFFTTKPTGNGTGLGLSLSYDIVKAHGGELTVETKEGEGSTFTIQIPTP